MARRQPRPGEPFAPPEGRRFLVVAADPELARAVSQALWDPPVSQTARAVDVNNALIAINSYLPHAVLVEASLVEDSEPLQTLWRRPILLVSHPLDPVDLVEQVNDLFRQGPRGV